MTELLERMKKPGLDDADVRELAIEVHKKFSIPLSCIFFGLLALPLGIRSHRAVKSRDLPSALLLLPPIIFCASAEKHWWKPASFSGHWCLDAEFFFAVLGVYLFYLANKEISLFQMVYTYFWRNKH